MHALPFGGDEQLVELGKVRSRDLRSLRCREVLTMELAEMLQGLLRGLELTNSFGLCGSHRRWLTCHDYSQTTPSLSASSYQPYSVSPS